MLRQLDTKPGKARSVVRISASDLAVPLLHVEGFGDRGEHLWVRFDRPRFEPIALIVMWVAPNAIPTPRAKYRLRASPSSRPSSKQGLNCGVDFTPHRRQRPCQAIRNESRYFDGA